MMVIYWKFRNTYVHSRTFKYYIFGWWFTVSHTYIQTQNLNSLSAFTDIRFYDQIYSKSMHLGVFKAIFVPLTINEQRNAAGMSLLPTVGIVIVKTRPEYEILLLAFI